MVCVGQNFLFQPRAAPLRQGSQAQEGIRNKFAHQGDRRARELSECQGSLCRRCPASSHHTGPAGIQEPVGPRRVFRAPLAEPRPQSLGPSPSLPPRSAIHAGLAPTAGPAGPRRDASLTFASSPGPAGLPPPRPPLHPAPPEAAAKSNAGFPRRPAVARRSQEVYAVAAASRFRPPPQGPAQSPSQPIHNLSCVPTPPIPPRPPDLPIRCPDRRNQSQRVSS